MCDKKTIYARFHNVATLHPDAIAVIQDDRSVTFAELERLIDSIIDKFDGKKHKLIGIVMQHGIMQIAAMLAVLKSGAGYVPAEPFLPAKRRDYMMKTACVSLIIDDDFCRDLPEDAPVFEDRSEPDGIAYVLYTSGTTGKPKGVVVENHSVVNYAEAFEAEMKVGIGDVMLQYSVCSFDIFVEEVFASLLNGVALAVPTPEIHNGPLAGLMEFCKRHGVTILDGFPYLIADINKDISLLPPTVKLIISGGDVVRESYITNLKDKGIKIYNTYGPSETTVCSNYFRIDNAAALDDGTYPIGKSVKGVEVKILGNDLLPVAHGEEGEICIFGKGVGRGYLGNPPEQANFITLPDGTRFYRSGDVGYERPDGNIVFLHRRDDQVMILGRRVEPEEVENVLNEYRGIERGVVHAFIDQGGLHYLVAYIVPRAGFSLTDLKSWMKSKLVDFMIPEFFVSLKHIPITHRGKLDVNALPIVLKEAEYK
ncbi:MAG: amino acid adenylation domain-containing protein [Paramuribaculum sp.]|nr:amino acid adenylation domain-containing protein [Paramuribaculum sp.]